MRSFLVFLLLFTTWFLWSGHTEPLMLAFGVVSCAIVVGLSRRMRLLDFEGFPFELTGRILTFIPWMLWQILVSNIQMARVIVQPNLRACIRPQVIRIRSSQKTPLGQVVLANAITITPGTVTLDVRNNYLVVHALTDAAAANDATGSVNARVLKLEGTH